MRCRWIPALTLPVRKTRSVGVMDRELVIFAHQPKTGGSTLRQIMGRIYSPEQTFVMHGVSPFTVQASINRLRALSDAEKRKIGTVTGHMPFGVHQFLPQQSSYITLLREPVERVISHLGHVIRNQHQWNAHDGNDWGEAEFFARGATPEAFLDWMEKFGFDNLQTRLLLEPAPDGWDRLAKPWPVLDERSLDSAKETLATRFAVAGTLERYDETLLLLQRRFNWRNVFYTKANTNPGRKTQREVGDKTVEMIRDRNRLDVEIVKFAGELLQEAIAREGPAFPNALREFQQRNSRYARVQQFKARGRALWDEARDKVRLRTRLKQVLAGA